MKLRNVCGLALMLCSVAASADEMGYEWWYGGLSVGGMTLEKKGTASHSYNLNGVIAKFGLQMGPYLSVEGHVGTTDSSNDPATGIAMEATYMAAGFARATLPLDHDKLRLYAMGGYSAFAVKGALAGSSKTFNMHGLAAGAGVELYGSRTTALYAEYMRYLTSKHMASGALGLDNDVNISSFNLGLVHHF